MSDERVNRRRFLVSGASIAAAAVSAEPVQAREIQGSEPWAPRQADVPQLVTTPDYVFFTTAELAFVEAATERLIPADDLGPGAKLCGVPLFIDHQLAGAYGRAQRWYMQGPWAKGTDTQGFQSRLAPAQMYQIAIRSIDQHVGATQGGKPFANLSPDAQDEVLSDIESGKIQLDGVDAATFFQVLWFDTKAGMFADPIYGGNKDMAAWKMLGFPGARYDYSDWVERHGQRYDLPPTSLAGRPAWNRHS